MFFIKSFYKSLYDFKYYAELHKQKIWKGFLYLSILSIILGIIIYLPIGKANVAEYDRLYNIFENNSPEFTITKDGMKVEGKSPYTIYDEANKGLLIIIDDTGTIDEYAYDEYASLFLILKDRIYIKSYVYDDSVTYDYIFSILPDTTIDKPMLLSYFSLLKKTNFFFMILLVLFFLITVQLGALVIGMFSRVITIFNKKTNMPLKEAYSISCYASTLPLLLISVIVFFNIDFQYMQLVYVLIGILYFINATNYIYPTIEQPKD